MRRPSPDALTAAEAVARRSHARATQIRRLFVERADVAELTPLIKMLRGGRGGAVRLKLYLAMLWLASAPPHDVAYPARAWATLLDLEDPEGKGARRVTDALGWLESNDFVSVESRPGHPNRITLLDESGTGRRYRVPGAVYNRSKAKGADPETLTRHRYVQLPASFWTSGWAATLSGPGLTMLLVLVVESSGKDKGEGLWFSPSNASNRYALSEDTRLTGLAELRRAGLVVARRRVIASDIFDVKRYRNIYYLNLDRLAEKAEVPDRGERTSVDLTKPREASGKERKQPSKVKLKVKTTS